MVVEETRLEMVNAEKVVGIETLEPEARTEMCGLAEIETTDVKAGTELSEIDLQTTETGRKDLTAGKDPGT
jgi:hypothetical protein